jgi:hypothetical protein
LRDYLERADPAAMDAITRSRMRRAWVEAVAGFAALAPLSAELVSGVLSDDELAAARLAWRMAGDKLDQVSTLRRPGLRLVGEI